jgi:hypothetical protein
VLSAAHLLSKAPLLKKLRALFDIHDVNSDGNLSQCECVLLLRSVLVVLCKLTNSAEPDQEQLELAASTIFSNASLVSMCCKQINY